MERVRHLQTYLEINISSTFTSLAQQTGTQRQSLSRSCSPVQMWSCPGANQNLQLLQGRGCDWAVILICHKCVFLPKGQPAHLTSGYTFLISHLHWYCHTLYQQIRSCCCCWPGFQLDEFLGLTQCMTKMHWGVSRDVHSEEEQTDPRHTQ